MDLSGCRSAIFSGRRAVTFALPSSRTVAFLQTEENPQAFAGAKVRNLQVPRAARIFSSLSSTCALSQVLFPTLKCHAVTNKNIKE